MSEEKKKSDSEKMRDEIDIAFAYQEGTEWLKTSNRLIKEFKGHYYKGKAMVDRYVVNTIFSLVNLILPNLIFSRPYIKVKAKTPYFMRKLHDGSYEKIDNIQASEIMEAAINHVMNDVDAWENMQQAIQDALFYSIGYSKVGYSVETVSADDIDFVKDENPFVTRVSPKDMGYHPLATNTGNAAIMVHHMVKFKEDLEENKNYKRVSEASASLPKELEEKIDKNKRGDITSDHIRVWEIHNQKKKEIYTYGGENKIFFGKQKRPYNFKGSDFVSIKFAGDNDDFLGIPLLGMIEDQAIAINTILTMMMRHVRMFPGVVDAEESAMDEDALQRLKNQEQGSIHVWNSINAIKRTPPLQMGTDYFSIISLLFSIIDRILGIPDFQRGSSTKRKTATEATYEQGDASIRREYFIGIVKKFVLQNVERVAALMQQFFDEERLIPIVGTADVRFVKFSKEDIQGEYMFDFDVDTMRFVNEAQVQQLINALNIMASHPALQGMLGTFDREKLAKELFKRMNMNIESFQSRDTQTKLYFTAEKENEMAVSGSDLPDPKMDEDHAHHLETHEEVVGNPEMERHKRFHQALQQQATPQVQEGIAPMQEGGGTQPNTPMGVNRADIFSAVSGG